MTVKLNNQNIPNNIQKSRFYETYKHVPKEYIKVAEGMEEQFVNMMISQMRKSVAKETKDSSAQQFYNSILDDSRAELMSKTDNGIGIKEVILDQILPPHLKPKNKNHAINTYKNQILNKGSQNE